MKTKKEIQEWLLANCVDEEGNLILTGLDLTGFEGDVFIDGLKVERNLFQRFQIVKGNLDQGNQKVGGNLYQDRQEVKGYLFQSNQKVWKNLYQANQEVKGDLSQDKKGCEYNKGCENNEK